MQINLLALAKSFSGYWNTAGSTFIYWLSFRSSNWTILIFDIYPFDIYLDPFDIAIIRQKRITSWKYIYRMYNTIHTDYLWRLSLFNLYLNILNILRWMIPIKCQIILVLIKYFTRDSSYPNCTWLIWATCVFSEANRFFFSQVWVVSLMAFSLFLLFLDPEWHDQN